MPVTTGKKAIRFKSLVSMQDSIEKDHLYQHRHLVLSYLANLDLPSTRKEISEKTNVPINAISKVVSTLVDESALHDAGRMQCEITGRDSRAVVYNRYFKGPF